ncbi:MAG: carboxypeptidase regulatory-like domain-containing protein [Acidobacteriota bacterium]|nr:MAG: carboxypeptidase regulatory-like domain-containing protein [Acidobacteriota bacterium]
MYLIPFLIAVLLPVTVTAQRPSGTISGRVVTDDGQPLPAAHITIIGAGSTGTNFQGRAMILTDEEGNFKAEGLDPMPYRIFAAAPGYVHIGGGDFSSSPVMGAVSNTPYRVGDFVSITMTRGAVITGRVLTSAGEPVVGINVRVIRVRDQTGRPVHGDTEALSFNNKTDDRGVYRIYGLAAGSYVVVAGGGAFSALQTPYDARVPVYYPSATRDTASELTVRAGEDFSGADIRYRSERGFVISGRVTGAAASARTSTMSVSLTSIMLRRAGSGDYVSSTFIPPNSEGSGFAFHGIPPGEYELEASRSGPVDDDPMISEPRKVIVSGADMTGINLPLVASASITGTVAIEKPDVKSACEGARDSILEEFQLTAVQNATGDAEKDRNALISSSNTPSPDARGDFRIRGLRADHYRIIVSLPSDELYLKSMAFDKPGRQPARDGLILKASEKVTSLKITAAHGAASLTGKVEQEEAKSLHAHLVPREVESKDDVLRYYEVPVEGREYKFTNLAPGKYRLVFKAGGKTPLAWNPAERAALRKEAETTERMVELKSCQQLTN